MWLCYHVTKPVGPHPTTAQNPLETQYFSGWDASPTLLDSRTRSLLAALGTLLALWVAWGLYVGRLTARVPFETLDELDGVEVRQYPQTVLVESGQETPLKHGTGLGLWLGNWLATQYGGSFQLSAEDGTVATLRLPAIDAGQSVEDAARRPTALLR